MDKYDNLYDYLSREDVAELGRSYLEGIFAGDGHEKRVEEYALSIFDALSPSQKVLRNLLSAAARSMISVIPLMNGSMIFIPVPF